MLLLVALPTVLVVSLLTPLALRPLLRRRGVVDIPNSRSSHTDPALRGVGLAPLLAIVSGYLILLPTTRDLPAVMALWVILGASSAAALLGWIEDLHGVPIRTRAGLQLAIGILGASAIGASTGSAWWAVIAWSIGIAAYVNVANFMDGINGISGLHAVIVGATYGWIGLIVEMPWLLMASLILATAFAGFLPWNLMRHGMFLGDVGSYLLGSGIAILAVAAVAHGVPAIAILGPLIIYLADTGATLAQRVFRHERWFEAHRSHFYQRLIDSGLSHFTVACIVAAASACTGLSGILIAFSRGNSVIGVIAIVITVMAYFSLGRILRRIRHIQTINHETRGAR